MGLSSRDCVSIGRRFLVLGVLLSSVAPLFVSDTSGQEVPVAVDPDVVRQSWPTMSDQAFVDSVLTSMPARLKWEQERLATYRQAIFAEATRRVDAAGDDLRPMAAHAHRLLGWFEEGKPGEKRLQEVAVLWLSKEDAVKVLTPPTVGRLVRFAGESLPGELREQLQAELKAGLPSVERMTLDELGAFADKLRTLSNGATSEALKRRQLTLEWMKAHRADELTERELHAVLFLARPEIPYRVVELVVDWEAEIIPPADGKYEFSVCPIALSTAFGTAYHRQWMTVAIDGSEVVKATPESWAYRGQPVSLRAAQPVSVRVSLRYEVERSVAREVAGQLYWKGPGISEQLVDAKFLRIPGSDEQGVRVGYRWKNRRGDEHEGDAVVPRVDQLLGICAPCSDEDLYQEYVLRAFDKSFAAAASAAASNEAKEGDKPAMHPWASDHVFGRERPYKVLSKHVSSAQRRAICDRLMSDATFLKDAYGNDLLPLYKTLRVGARREALDLMGTWMQQNSDITPRLTANNNDYFWRNRQDYRFAVAALAFEDSEPIEWLEADYLVDEEGVCCLPVAYTLAYSNVLRGTILDWISILDGRLADESLAGDRRVNWLIARAMAEEIRHEVADRHIRGLPNLSEGMGWLDEAMMVAESEEVKNRLRIERASRFTSLHQWEAAREELAGVGELAPQLARVAELEKAVAQRIAQRQQQAEKSYVAELERRAKRAEQRGDSDSQERYLSTLQSVKSTTEGRQ